MSIFSDIDAEIHRKIIKRIINNEKQKLGKLDVDMLPVQHVVEILNRILKKCEEEIQE